MQNHSEKARDMGVAAEVTATFADVGKFNKIEEIFNELEMPEDW